MAEVLGQFIGLKEANAALKKLPEFAKVRAQGVMDTTAARVVLIARAKAPRLSGLLQSDIQWASRPRSVGAVVGITSAFYWKFLEYGTVKMGARPMFRPAADAVRESHEAQLMAVLEDAAIDVERAQGHVSTGLL